MPYLILSITLWATLTLAMQYYHWSDAYEVLRAKTEKISWHITLPLLFLILNFPLLTPALEQGELIVVTILFLLTFIFFLIALIKKLKNPPAIIIAAIISEALILAVFYSHSEWMNNILLITSYIGAVTLFVKQQSWPQWVWSFIFIVIAIADITWVWLIPIIPIFDTRVQPLLYSLVLKVGPISLGAGDLVLTILAALLIAHESVSRKTIIAIILLGAVPLLVYVLLKLAILPNDYFPYMIIATPIFLLFYLKKTLFAKQ